MPYALLAKTMRNAHSGMATFRSIHLEGMIDLLDPILGHH